MHLRKKKNCYYVLAVVVAILAQAILGQVVAQVVALRPSGLMAKALLNGLVLQTLTQSMVARAALGRLEVDQLAHRAQACEQSLDLAALD